MASFQVLQFSPPHPEQDSDLYLASGIQLGAVQDWVEMSRDNLLTYSSRIRLATAHDREEPIMERIPAAREAKFRPEGSTP